ncbi:MAG TPA: 3-hydroxyacyl-CoA dehydrogenase family protein [Flavisolibacter sp.]|jgi:3-hydroxybutyryl-CoA dehydrogenase|nr:3-hydroxyacyl-CoA dehydrogenase family protein [Flavisolibacter sp.]
MQVVVLAHEWQKVQLGEVVGNIRWISDASAFAEQAKADAFVDLTFTATKDRLAILRALLPKPVIVNSVSETLQETDVAFIRINGWNTFLSSSIWEAACSNEASRQKGGIILALFNRKAEWLPDTPGFVTARVVSTIINEAFLALEEGVSTKAEINTAMKLGTAYPYGPFDWAEKIGLQNVVALLQKLAQTKLRYTPAALLLEEASLLT